MIADRLRWIGTVVRNTRNPTPIFREWLGWQRGPYRVTSRGGALFELRPGRGDWFGYMETLLRCDYLSLGQRLDAGATVVDIGANVGGFAVSASQRIGRSGRVVAVEPEPNNFRQLEVNAALNPGYAPIQTLCCAVGGKRGEAVLHSDEKAMLSSFHQLETRRSHTVDLIVPVLTLEDVFDQARVEYCHYLKIDAEGSEYDIIGTLTPRMASRVEQITIEMHDFAGHERSEIHSKLEAMGYKVKPGVLTYAYRQPA
jgi:FkbM family methyltransferase